MKLNYLIPLLFLISCKKDIQPIEIKNAHGKLVQRITVLGDTSKGKYGKYEKFDDEGKIFEVANYVNGKLEGEKRFYDKGILYSIEHHKNDNFEGPYKIFYPDGQVQMETQYVNNEITGELRSYFSSGKIKEIVFMKANMENGPFIEYYENGNKKAEGNYKPFEEGPREDGLLVMYDSTGALLRKMQCVDGVCNTIKN
ncbi:MAG: toxin-antitoxin system YwqK family antitoxin [Saprospiraceae bacterium]|nr:toxin-antitoxin system YwqK family antitoxin [Saprospiraceae bacterium]